MNSLSISRLNYELTFCFTHSLFISKIFYEFTFIFAKSRRPDTDTIFFWTSDAGTDLDKVMTSDTDMGSDKGMFENLGHGFELGKLSDTHVRPTPLRSSR